MADAAALMRRLARTVVPAALDRLRRLVRPGLRHRLTAAHRARVVARFDRRRTLPEERRRRILIGLIEHLGDIVAAEPLVAELRERHPEGLVVWAVCPAYRELVEAHPLVDGIVPVRCLGEWLALCDRLGHGRVYDLHLGGRACEACDARIRVSSGDVTIHDYYDRGSLLDAYRHRAGLAAAGPAADPQPRVHIPEEVLRSVDALGLPEDYVVVHARSNDPERDWTDEKWRALAHRLRNRDVVVVEVGLDPVLRLTDPGYLDFCGRLSIMETAETIRRARCFVGIDSGPAHLANAVGCPGVILLGQYYDFEGHTPYSGAYASGRATLLRQEGAPVRELPVDAVERAVADRRQRSRSVAT